MTTPKIGLYLTMPGEPTRFGPFVSAMEARQFFDATTYEWWSRKWTPEQVDDAFETARTLQAEMEKLSRFGLSIPAELYD